MPKIIIHHRRPEIHGGQGVPNADNTRITDCSGDVDYSAFPENIKPKCRDSLPKYQGDEFGPEKFPIESEFITPSQDIGSANIYVAGNALYGTLLCTFEVVEGCGPWKFNLRTPPAGNALKFFTLNKRLGRQFTGEKCDSNHNSYDDDFFNDTDAIDKNALIVTGEQVNDNEAYYIGCPNPELKEWEYALTKTSVQLEDEWRGEFYTNWNAGTARTTTTALESYYRKYGYDWPPPPPSEGAESLGKGLGETPKKSIEIQKVYPHQLTEPNGDGDYRLEIEARNAIGERVVATVNIKTVEVLPGKQISLVEGATLSGGVKYTGGEDCKFPTVTDLSGNVFGGIPIPTAFGEGGNDPYIYPDGFKKGDPLPGFELPEIDPDTNERINDRNYYGPYYRHTVTSDLILDRTIIDLNSPEGKKYIKNNILTEEEYKYIQDPQGRPDSILDEGDAKTERFKTDFGWKENGFPAAIKRCLITRLRDPFLEKIERIINYEIIENTCRPVMTVTVYYPVTKVKGTVILGTTGDADFVDSVVITNGGRSGPPVKGYFPNATNIPVTFESPNSAGDLNPTGETATGYAISNSEGVVTGVVIVNPGSEYITAPAITFASTSNAITTAILGDGVLESEEGDIIATDGVASVTVEFGGFGYSEPFTNKALLNIPVTFEVSPTGDTATGYAFSNSDGEVLGIIITNTGSGYTSAPLVVVDPPPPATDALLEGKPIPSGVTQETDRCPCGPDICNTEEPDPCANEEVKDPWE